jgi:hypothetical protein
MTTFIVRTIDEVLSEYVIDAETEAEARAKLDRSLWNAWRDLGFGERTIVEVVEEKS